MIVDALNKELYIALKSKDTFKLSVVRYVLSKIKNREIEVKAEGRELTDEDVLMVLKRLIKQRKQSIEGFKAANRPDGVERETKELEIIQNYFDMYSGNNHG